MAIVLAMEDPSFSGLLAILACPRDHSALHGDGDRIYCEQNHRYPIVNGIPVLLLPEKNQTIGIAAASAQAAETGAGAPLYIDTLGLSEAEKRGIEQDWRAGSAIDPAISYLIAATSGLGYVNRVGRLRRYPVPEIPIADGKGGFLLDIGSNWGRWSVSAARKGWRVIALDPSLGALLASQRAFSATGLGIRYVCGDARYLPFKPGVFQGVFSYSVLQHFSEQDAERAIAEAGRTLQSGAFAKVQMAHKGGLRARHVVSRSDYAKGGVFRVRYWSLVGLRDLFERHIGPTRLTAEAFGGLGLLAEDWNSVSMKAKILIAISTVVKQVARVAPIVMRLADSVYVTAVKR